MTASNLLAGISPSDVVAEPFPHVVIHDPIPTAECSALIEAWPSDDVIQAGAPAKSNQRFSLPAAKVIANENVDAQWRAFIAEQSGAAFGRHLLRVFGASLPGYLPTLDTRLVHRPDQCRFGIRGLETGEEEWEIVLAFMGKLERDRIGACRSASASSLSPIQPGGVLTTRSSRRLHGKRPQRLCRRTRFRYPLIP